MYDIIFTGKAAKENRKIIEAGLEPQVTRILKTVMKNPYEQSQGFEKLVGDNKGSFSRRINQKHRFVYQILPNTTEARDKNGELYEGIIKVSRMWTHYE